jgi:hypothetical protein
MWKTGRRKEQTTAPRGCPVSTSSFTAFSAPSCEGLRACARALFGFFLITPDVPIRAPEVLFSAPDVPFNTPDAAASSNVASRSSFSSSVSPAFGDRDPKFGIMPSVLAPEPAPFWRGPRSAPLQTAPVGRWPWLLGLSRPPHCGARCSSARRYGARALLSPLQPNTTGL